PRAWGRRDDNLRKRLAVRYTPTRVGTTPHGRRPANRPAVHPHARGDDTTSCSSRIRGGGTPPRAWGRRCYHGHNDGRTGTPPRAWGRLRGASQERCAW